jgi:hypothetical protein
MEDGPRQAEVHYALALLRTGDPADEGQRKREVDAMLALPSADMRVELAGQHVIALYAKGRVADADRLLADILESSAVQAKVGTILRTLLLPLWVDDALGRHDDAQRLLSRLEGLLRKPGMRPDDVRQVQWILTAHHGIVDAETGKLTEAREERAALKEVPATDTLYRTLVEELTGRIQLREGGPVSDATAASSLPVRVRAAHLAGRTAERDGNDALAEQRYRVLLEMARACANSDLAFVMTCTPYLASGLARLARVQAKLGEVSARAETLRAFDSVWPSPDPSLEPVRIAAQARESTR